MSSNNLTGHATAAGRCVMDLDSAACSTTDLVLANVVQTCIDDLLQVINLRSEPVGVGCGSIGCWSAERTSVLFPFPSG
jgi:hypothetical protein